MKLIKFGSAALAATMAFSAAPVFAADNSPIQGDVNKRPGVTEATVDGIKIEVTDSAITDEKVLEVVNDEQKVKDILKENGYKVPTGATVVVLGEGDYSYEVNGKPEELKKAVEMSFDAANLAAKDGDQVFVLHLKHDGKWEVISAVVEKGIIKVTLDGLSPVAFYKVVDEKTGKVVEITKEEAAKAGVNTTTAKVEKKSPNTGI